MAWWEEEKKLLAIINSKEFIYEWERCSWFVLLIRKHAAEIHHQRVNNKVMCDEKFIEKNI